MTAVSHVAVICPKNKNKKIELKQINARLLANVKRSTETMEILV